MIRRHLATVAAVLLPFVTHAAESSHETGLGVAVDDRFGGVYFCGTSDGSFQTQNAGASDAWLARFTTDGRQQWIQQIKSAGADVAVAVAADGFGNVYVAGQSMGALDGSQNSGGSDVWLAKYNVLGKRLWLREFGGSVNDGACDVTADAAGNVYIVGFTSGSLGGAGAGGDDAWIAKYTPSGSRVWISQFGSPAEDIAYAVAVGANGVIYIGGCTDGKLGIRNEGLRDTFIAGYAPNGVRLWVRQYGSVADDMLYDLNTDEKGNVVATGLTYGNLGGQSSGPDSDPWLAQFNSAGIVSWIRHLDVRNNEMANAVASRGGAVVAAGFLETLTASDDAWATTFNTSGKTAYSRLLSTDGDEEFNGVAIDGSGNIYFATDSTTTNSDGEDETDAVLLSINAKGLPRWSKRVEGVDTPNPIPGVNTYVSHQVPPTAADPAADPSLQKHLTFSLGQPAHDGRLVVFLPGTAANASMYSRYLMACADEGYYVLGLNYPNKTTVDTYCDNSTDSNCAAKVRGEFLTGQDLSPLVTVAPANSINHLLLNALIYLDSNFPAEGWNTWIDSVHGLPLWSNIIVAGHSQGGGYAGFVAKTYYVSRAVMIAGPAERLPNGAPVPWVSAPGPTPITSFYAFGHVNDCFYPRYNPSWVAMGLDNLGPTVNVDSSTYSFSGTHHILTSVPPADGKPAGLKCHNSLAVDVATPLLDSSDPLYGVQRVWKYITEVP